MVISGKQTKWAFALCCIFGTRKIHIEKKRRENDAPQNETNTKKNTQKYTEKYRQFLFSWTNTKHHITNATKSYALISFSTYPRTIGYFILHHRLSNGDWFFESFFFFFLLLFVALDLQERSNIYVFVYVYRIWNTSDRQRHFEYELFTSDSSNIHESIESTANTAETESENEK